jgi:inner membrane protein
VKENNTMIIAHGPAGYLLTKFFAKTILRKSIPEGTSSRRYNTLILAGIIGGIMPDFDFAYHVFIDSDRTPHHAYITHMPVFWISLIILSVIAGRLFKKPYFSAISIAMYGAALLHLVCDTLTGEIYWLYPFSMHPFNVFSVHGTYIWWVHNYMYHWTFLIEIAIVTAAMVVFLRIPETIRYLFTIIQNDRKLQLMLVRLTVCMIGISMIILIGSIKFDFDNRVIQKVIKLKHYVSRNVSVIR